MSRRCTPNRDQRRHCAGLRRPSGDRRWSWCAHVAALRAASQRPSGHDHRAAHPDRRSGQHGADHLLHRAARHAAARHLPHAHTGPAPPVGAVDERDHAGLRRGAGDDVRPEPRARGRVDRAGALSGAADSSEQGAQGGRRAFVRDRRCRGHGAAVHRVRADWGGAAGQVLRAPRPRERRHRREDRPDVGAGAAPGRRVLQAAGADRRRQDRRGRFPSSRPCCWSSPSCPS